MDLTTSLNETSVSNWLNQFVAKRKHQVEIGDPLFRFHMTRDEYESLKKILARTMKYGASHSISKEWYAGFVLYCSEWFRREYSRDWSWIPILNSLGCNDFTVAQRLEAINKGLIGYWKRPLSKYQNENNDYLGSLFREGGLPSNLLSKDTNNYQSTFYSIFERYQEIKDLGINHVENLIATKIARLPEAFRKQESVELIADMIEQLDTLVYKFGLDKQSDPAGYLDMQMPQWRRNFPLPLEDEIGSAFLGQLLARATNEVKKVSKTRKNFSCHHYISFLNQSISSVITLADNYDFNISKSSLSTSRVELVIAEGDTPVASLGSAYIQFEGERSLIRFRNAKATVRRQNYGRELYICVMQSGCIIASVRLTGSTIDIGEAPIILSEDESDWKIIGQASVNVKQPKVGLLLPQQAKVEVERGELSPTTSSIHGLTLNLFEGKCLVTVSLFETYTITTGAENLLGNNLILKGLQLSWATTPPLVFKGVPSIGEDPSSAGTYELKNIRSYLGDQDIASMCKTEVNGRHLFTAKTNEGVVLFRKKIGILPRDFDIELIAGDSFNRGVIKCITAAPCVCEMVTPGVHEVSNFKRDGYRELVISSEKLPSATVTLKVTAGLMAEPILIEVPFPSKGAIAYNKDGHELAHNLTIDDLIGSRLHLFSTSGYPVNFFIDLVNRTIRDQCDKNPYYRWSYKVSDKPVEVSLYGLKDAIIELLSLSDKLDSDVELTISGPIRPVTYLISRYSTMIDYDKSKNTVSISSADLLSSEKVKPVLISLSAPEQPPLLLESKLSESVPTGEFELPNYLAERGPWLVVPAQDSEILFRAKFIPGQVADRSDFDIKTLQKAAVHYHHELNNHVIDDVLTLMSDKWTHSGWQYLIDTYQKYSYLPLTTFEVWRHLLKNHRALAVALLRLDNAEVIIPHLENQFPIFWEFIALIDWQHAIGLMKETLKSSNLDEALIQQVLETKLKKIADAIPALSGEISSYLISQVALKPFPAALMKGKILIEEDSWFQSLLQQHSGEDHWPEEYSAELMKRCSNIKEMPFGLKVNHSYQAGVVFMPVFAAAVTTGVIKADEVRSLPLDAIFHFRKLRDFDREWFEPMYRYFVTYFLSLQ